MAFFPETAAEALAGQTVRAAMLVHFDFLDDPMRVWQGFGALHTQDDEDWQGLGELGTIGGIESAIAGTSPQVTFSLSGVDPAIVAKTLASSDQVRGRDVTIYLQFFDDGWQTLDAPYALWCGVMDVMQIKAAGPTERTVSLTAETLFTRRGLSPFGYLSDADQNALHPDDRGLEHVASMATKHVIWPAW